MRQLDTLKTDTCGLDGKESDSSADDASARTRFTNASIERTPSERHAFLFRHNLSTSSPYLRDLHPLPSQIPFLLEIFLENVNVLLRIVHMPTITQTVRDLRDGSMARLTSSNEALMFSIYYAAIASMEEDEVSHGILIARLKKVCLRWILIRSRAGHDEFCLV